jgi:hypothetical protein
MADNLELALKIKALVEGAKNVQGLANEIKQLAGVAKQGVPDPTQGLREGAKQTSSVIADLEAELSRLVTLGAIVQFVRSSVEAARQMEVSLRNLQAVASASGVGIGQAFAVAQRLSADGLINLEESARALQNLLSRGYSINQAEQTLTALKKIATFGRDANLSLGQAVMQATDALKEENSRALQNSGVIAKVSDIHDDYAKKLDLTAAELTRNEKIQAEMNAILQQTAIYTGQASQASEGLDGAFNGLNNATHDLKVSLGERLTPAITTLLKWGTALMDEWVNPFLGGIEIMAIKTAALAKSIGDIAHGNFSEVKKNFELADQMALEVVQRHEKGATAAQNNITAGVNQEAAARKKAADAAKEQEQIAARAAANEAKALELTRAQLEAQTSLLQDHLKRQQTDLDHQLQQALLSYRDYYARRAELQRQDLNAQLRGLDQQIAAEQSVAAKLLSANKKNDAIPVQANIEKLRAQRTIVQREIGDINKNMAADLKQSDEQFADQWLQLSARLLEAEGQTAEAAALKLTAELRDLFRRAGVEIGPEAEGFFKKIFDVTLAQAEIDKIQKKHDAALAQMQATEQDITAQREAGLIGEIEARRRIVDLHHQTAQALGPVIENMRAAAVTDEQKRKVEELAVAYRQLAAEIDPIAQRINTSIESGMADAFTDFIKGAKSAKEAFQEFANSVVAALQRIAAEKIAESIFTGFNMSSIGSFFAAAVHHTGGMVGAGGGATRMVSPLAFLGAPRFHSGGIAGLASDEVPAILQRGETVLPRGQAPGARPDNVKITIENRGTPQKAIDSQVSFDPEAMVVKVIIDDVMRGGPASSTLARAFGLRRQGG